jgi:hypothetical protein
LDNVYDEHDPSVNESRNLTAEDMGVLVLKPEDESTPPDQSYNRGEEPETTWPDKIPAEALNNLRDPDDNAGSGRVIPENHDFVNKEASFDKEAIRISEIQDGCSPDLHSKSEKIRIKLRRVDPKNLMWLFTVTGSKGKIYKVRIKVLPKGNLRNVNKTDILVSCSCPYWRWQGPEYHAKEQGYLLGRPVGLATRPEVKDPHNNHGACKHVLAVLKRVSTFVLPGSRPRTPKVASLQYLADRLAYGRVGKESDPMVDRVSSRYLSRVK